MATIPTAQRAGLGQIRVGAPNTPTRGTLSMPQSSGGGVGNAFAGLAANIARYQAEEQRNKNAAALLRAQRVSGGFVLETIETLSDPENGTFGADVTPEFRADIEQRYQEQFDSYIESVGGDLDDAGVLAAQSHWTAQGFKLKNALAKHASEQAAIAYKAEVEANSAVMVNDAIRDPGAIQQNLTKLLDFRLANADKRGLDSEALTTALSMETAGQIATGVVNNYLKDGNVPAARAFLSKLGTLTYDGKKIQVDPSVRSELNSTIRSHEEYGKAVQLARKYSPSQIQSMAASGEISASLAKAAVGLDDAMVARGERNRQLGEASNQRALERAIASGDINGVRHLSATLRHDPQRTASLVQSAELSARISSGDTTPVDNKGVTVLHAMGERDLAEFGTQEVTDETGKTSREILSFAEARAKVALIAGDAYVETAEGAALVRRARSVADALYTKRADASDALLEVSKTAADKLREHQLDVLRATGERRIAALERNGAGDDDTALATARLNEYLLKLGDTGAPFTAVEAEEQAAVISGLLDPESRNTSGERFNVGAESTLEGRSAASRYGVHVTTFNNTLRMLFDDDDMEIKTSHVASMDAWLANGRNDPSGILAPYYKAAKAALKRDQIEMTGTELDHYVFKRLNLLIRNGSADPSVLRKSLEAFRHAEDTKRAEENIPVGGPPPESAR